MTDAGWMLFVLFVGFGGFALGFAAGLHKGFNNGTIAGAKMLAESLRAGGNDVPSRPAEEAQRGMEGW